MAEYGLFYSGIIQWCSGFSNLGQNPLIFNRDNSLEKIFEQFECTREIFFSDTSLGALLPSCLCHLCWASLNFNWAIASCEDSIEKISSNHSSNAAASLSSGECTPDRCCVSGIDRGNCVVDTLLNLEVKFAINNLEFALQIHRQAQFGLVVMLTLIPKISSE